MNVLVTYGDKKMKKIVFFVLVLVFGFSILSAENMTLYKDGLYFEYDNDTKESSQMLDTIKTLQDYEVVAFLMSKATYILSMFDAIFYDVSIIDCNELTKKYNFVICYDEDYTTFTMYQNLGNDKMIQLVYTLM